MNAASFLFVSADAALITDLAWQIHREGHDVKYYIEADTDRGIGDGFGPKTDDRRADVDRADVIVFDDIWVGSDIGTGGLARELREQGNAVVGGTPNTDRLEEDRGYAMEVLEDHGVNTSEHHVFDSFDAGIRHVRENPAPYVIKPLGEVQNVKRLLYVGNEDDGSDVASRYVSVFADDTSREVARVHGLEIGEEDEPDTTAPVECPRCHQQTPREMNHCLHCRQTIDKETALQREQTCEWCGSPISSYTEHIPTCADVEVVQKKS